MTSPFKLLGVAADADERTIKLAYAKLLKLTRPDDDPEGFQRLNQAYQQALKVARSRSAGMSVRRGHASSQPMVATLNLSPGATPRVTRAGEPVHTGPSRPPPILRQPAPESSAPRPQRPAFDAQAFLAEYRRISAADGANALSRWLMDYPAFWHLPTKHAAGQWLLRTLFEKPEAMPEGCFTATSEFFHYEDAISDVDPLVLRRVATRINAASLVKPEHARDLALLAFGNALPKTRRISARAVRRLSRPFHWWLDLPRALLPAATRRTAKVATALCNGSVDDLPPTIDAAHARFWINTGGQSSLRFILLLYLVRSITPLVLIPSFLTALDAWLLWLTNAPRGWRPALEVWKATTLTIGVVAVMFWLVVGSGILFRIVDELGDRFRGFRVLMFCLTPVMCIAAMIVAGVVDATLGTLIAIATMLAAGWRLREVHRVRWSNSFGGIGFIVLFALYVGVATAIFGAFAKSGGWFRPEQSPALAIALIALAFWAIDWFKRGFLRPRTPRATRNPRRSRPV